MRRGRMTRTAFRRVYRQGAPCPCKHRGADLFNSWRIDARAAGRVTRQVIMPDPTLTLRGATLYQGWLSPEAQARLVLEDMRDVVAQAPLVRPVTPSGKAMSVRMTAAGRSAGYSDRKGYRYEPRHPDGRRGRRSRRPPGRLAGADRRRAARSRVLPGQFYEPEARMGLHQDSDEADFLAGGVDLARATRRSSGSGARPGRADRVGLAAVRATPGGARRRGAARLSRRGPHPAGSSTLLRSGGRINLTMRVVDLTGPVPASAPRLPGQRGVSPRVELAHQPEHDEARSRHRSDTSTRSCAGNS